MITKIIPMDTALTVLKSVSVMSIRACRQRSFADRSMPPLSYVCRIWFSSLICALSSSVATLYSELTSTSWYFIILSVHPVTELRNHTLRNCRTRSGNPSPSAHFITVHLFHFTSAALATSADSAALSTRIICVVFMS